MLRRALPLNRVRRVLAVSDKGGRRVPLLLAAAVVPSAIMAPLVGDADYFGSLLYVAYLSGVVFLFRNLIHWPRWSLALHRQLTTEHKQVDPRAVRRLAVCMALELLLAFYWVLAAGFLQSPELLAITTTPIEVPLALWFLVSLVLLAWLPAGLASEAAQDLGLSSTTEAIRGSRLGPVMKRASGPFTELCLYREIGEWFGPKLPDRRASGVAFGLIAVILLMALEGAAAFVGIRGTGAFNEHVLNRGQAAAVPPRHEPGPVGDGLDPLRAEPAPVPACSGVEPGEPAPQPWASELYGLWYGSAGVEGVGNVIAGCPQPAEPEPGQPGVWLVRGRCAGALQGLAVASSHGDPAMLLQEAARVGLGLADEGILLSASPRTRIGEGDLHVLQTVRGSYVLVRAKRSAGRTRADAGVERCGAFADRNVRYTVAPPGLIGIWLQIAERDWVWPVSDSSAGGSRQDFAFIDAESGGLVASAHCTGDLACSGTFQGRPLSTAGPRTVWPARFEALGPGT
jgi:hypothetical protein